MIRFVPDNWVDALLRPLDMISPEANIYVEVQAPDLRLAAVILLGLGVLVCARRGAGDRRPALQLLALTLLAMAPWLATSGNGRYFTPFLLLLGPMCVGLVRLLPLSTSMKFSTVALRLLVQGVLLFEASPWGGWALANWRDSSYFQVSASPVEGRSYATLAPLSYSLIAPQFPAQSRWMNLSAPVSGPRERAYARKWLTDARSLYLLAPAYPSQVERNNQPSVGVVTVFNQLIAARGLSVSPGAQCEWLSSAGLASMASRYGSPDDPSAPSSFGFWLCPLRFDAARIAEAAGSPENTPVDAVFAAVEKLCPRFFPAGEAGTQHVEGGAVRHYASSDTRVYVLDDGEVLYKFWRSLNAVTIGKRADVLAGRARVDCSRIRAPTWRSGGP